MPLINSKLLTVINSKYALQKEKMRGLTTSFFQILKD